MNIINVEHLYKIYGEKIIFDDITLSVNLDGQGKNKIDTSIVRRCKAPFILSFPTFF